MEFKSDLPEPLKTDQKSLIPIDKKTSNFSTVIHSIDLTSENPILESVRSPEHKLTILSKNLSPGIQSLDVFMTASQIKRFAVDQANNVFVPYLHLNPPKYQEGIPVPGLETHKFKMAESNHVSCEEAKRLIEESGLMERMAAAEYNSLPTICGFLEHAHKHSELSPAEAFRTYQADSTGELDRSKGATCSGISRAFVEDLSKGDLKLTAYPVVERFSTLAVPNHAAVMVPCNDGVLFIELLHPQHIAKVKSNEVENLKIQVEFMDKGIAKKDLLNMSFKVIRTQEDYKIENLVMARETVITNADTGEVVGSSQSQYLLRGVANPDSPVMTRYMLVRDFYPLSGKARSNGDELNVKVNYDSSTVTLQRKGKEKFFKVVLPFHVFDAKTHSIDPERESDLEKREALQKALYDFIGEGTLESYWNEFQAPEAVKQQIFTLTEPENVEVMLKLYSQVSRDKENLEPRT